MFAGITGVKLPYCWEVKTFEGYDSWLTWSQFDEAIVLNKDRISCYITVSYILAVQITENHLIMAEFHNIWMLSNVNHAIATHISIM